MNANNNGGNVIPFRPRKNEAAIICEAQELCAKFGEPVDFDCQKTASDYQATMLNNDANLRAEIVASIDSLLHNCEDKNLAFVTYTYSENAGRELYHTVVYFGSLNSIAPSPNFSVTNWDEYFNNPALEIEAISTNEPQLTFVVIATHKIDDGSDELPGWDLVNIPLSAIVGIYER